MDGPARFASNDTLHPLGRTALKRRLLRALGWAVLPVPYWEWEVLGSAAEQRAYLAERLQGGAVADTAGGGRRLLRVG